MKLDTINYASGILDNVMQTKSGAIKTKIIYATKITILKYLSIYKELNIPFIIDSIMNNELSNLNGNLILNCIKEHLPHNQIIIASIFKDFGDYKFNKIITLDGKALDKVDSLFPFE
ncbi:MAG: hypothetical protein R3Y13_05870 [bacterium]